LAKGTATPNTGSSKPYGKVALVGVSRSLLLIRSVKL